MLFWEWTNIMADRAYMKCPACRDSGNATPPELMRNQGDPNFFCPLGHVLTPERLQLLRPEMIRLQPTFKPRDTDVKAEFWCNPDVLQKAKEALGVNFHRTLESILQCALTGDYILVDGQQATELTKLGVRNGAEMLATAKENQRLAGENEEFTKMEIRRAAARRQAEEQLGVEL